MRKISSRYISIFSCISPLAFFLIGVVERVCLEAASISLGNKCTAINRCSRCTLIAISVYKRNSCAICYNAVVFCFRHSIVCYGNGCFISIYSQFSGTHLYTVILGVYNGVFNLNSTCRREVNSVSIFNVKCRTLKNYAVTSFYSVGYDSIGTCYGNNYTVQNDTSVVFLAICAYTN